jgi:glycosyltransferase involved in cell wall biosynthesis
MARLRVRIDATALLVNHESGVGKFCRGLLAELGKKPDIDAAAFAVTWRRREQLGAVVPSGVPAAGRPMPARPLRAIWLRGDWPPIEWFVGRSDVVHGTNFVVPPTQHAARVVTVHDLTPVKYPELCDPGSLVFPELVRRAVRNGAWVHTHSQFVAEEVIDVFGVDPARVRAIPPGIPELCPDSTFASVTIRSQKELPEGVRRYILAVGTIEPRKNFPGLVEAFDRIATIRPDVALIIIGSDGWGANELAAAIAAATSRDRIVRPGYVTDADLAAWLRGAAVLAYPSRYEGFGFPPLLAMSLGVPVVATAAGSIPEVVGDAAFVVPVDDVHALAEGLAAVLDDEERARALRDAGPERAGYFTWERCASGMVDLYDAAAAGRTR